MKLYSYWRSSCSWRVRIALQLKELSFETIPVHLVQDGGQQHHDAHTKRNPMAQVPALELDDGTIINQSLAIISYLEEQTPTPNLLGQDPLERAWIWELSEIINAGIQPLQNLSVLQYIQREHQLDKRSWGCHFIQNGLEALEKRIAHKKNLYLASSRITLADLCLIPQLYNARRFSCDLSRVPHLLSIEERCAAHLAFQQAHPSQQPDAQP